MNAINAKRVAAGLRQEDVARELNIDRSTVAKWETGRAKPRADALIKLARLFGCTVGELLCDTAVKNIPTAQLVEELKSREGVQTHIAEPHTDIPITVNGPAIVLVVVD